MSPEMVQIMGTWGPIVLMVVFFYFFLYRPQKKEQARRANLLDSLKKGDRVVTIGGLFGTLTKVSDRTVHMEVCKGMEIEVVRASINSKVNENGADIV